MERHNVMESSFIGICIGRTLSECSVVSTLGSNCLNVKKLCALNGVVIFVVRDGKKFSKRQNDVHVEHYKVIIYIHLL